MSTSCSKNKCIGDIPKKGLSDKKMKKKIAKILYKEYG